MDKHKKKIIEALKHGVPMRRISRELKIPIATISVWCKKDKELAQALTEYQISVQNIFC